MRSLKKCYDYFMDLAKQYNNFADDFSKHHIVDKNSNKASRECFYNHIDFLRPRMKLLDLACGDGTDLIYYKKLGADIYGVDASEKLFSVARNKLPDANLKIGLFENIPFEDNFFDVVLSKYAIQTSSNLSPVFSEIHRVLKSGGIMMYLTVHPFRQYFEKKEVNGNYFEQKIVDSHLFSDQVTVKEPTHTLTEYLNDFLFNNFDVQAYDEGWEPAAEFIDGKRYPGFFIIKAKKR